MPAAGSTVTEQEQEPQETRRPPKPGSDAIVDAVLGLYTFARDTGGELFLLPGALLRDEPYIPRSFLTHDVRYLVHLLWRGMAECWNGWAGQLTDDERKKQNVKFASRVPGPDTVSGITQHLEALGMKRGRLVTAELRAARSNGGLVIDLGDATGDVVWLEPGKWEIRDPRDLPCEPPVFRRSTGYLPLPRPERGGDWDELRAILRIRDEGAWNLVTGWSVSAYFGHVSRPGLWFDGAPGSGKTTAGGGLARLIDGTEWLDGRLDKNDERNNIIRAVKCYVVSFDNMSAVTADMSDFICQLVTGHRDTFRKMRSNFDDISVAYKRTFVATGLSLPYGLGADALDRIIEIPLAPIAEAERVTDEQIRAELDEARPRLLGALLDHVARVLEILPQIPVETGLARMNAYARILIAHDAAYGDGRSAPCLDAYQASLAVVRQDRADAEPVVVALRKLIHPGCAWQGTAAELYAVLPRTFAQGEFWPSDARALSDKLTALDGVLGVSGFSVGRKRSNGRKWITIERRPS